MKRIKFRLIKKILGQLDGNDIYAYLEKDEDYFEIEFTQHPKTIHISFETGKIGYETLKKGCGYSVSLNSYRGWPGISELSCLYMVLTNPGSIIKINSLDEEEAEETN